MPELGDNLSYVMDAMRTKLAAGDKMALGHRASMAAIKSRMKRFALLDTGLPLGGFIAGLFKSLGQKTKLQKHWLCKSVCCL